MSKGGVHATGSSNTAVRFYAAYTRRGMDAKDHARCHNHELLNPPEKDQEQNDY